MIVKFSPKSIFYTANTAHANFDKRECVVEQQPEESRPLLHWFALIAAGNCTNVPTPPNVAPLVVVHQPSIRSALLNTCIAPHNLCPCFGNCLHNWMVEHHHQLTWALGCRVGPCRADSGWCLDIHLLLIIFLSWYHPLCLSFRSLLFNFPCHRITSSCVKPQTMAVVSVRISFPHAPLLFLFSALSLITYQSPLSHTLQSRDNGPCPLASAGLPSARSDGC